jgi:hypothetical protein
MRHVLQPSTVKEFQASLDHLVASCVTFKLAQPHVVPATRMDRGALHRATEVTDAGEELNTVVTRFVHEVLGHRTFAKATTHKE